MTTTDTEVRVRGIGHVGILVDDLHRSKKFYEEVVGLEEHNRVPKGSSDQDVQMIFFGTKEGTRTNGVHHALVIRQAPEDVDVSSAVPLTKKAIQQIAFQMGSRQDFEDALAHLAANGVPLTERTRHDETEFDSGSDSAYFQDPDGNRVEFFLMPSSET